MSVAVAEGKRVWTEAELQALPDDGFIHELVNGELAVSPKNNFQHEDICSRLFFALEQHNRLHRRGRVMGSNLGCWMESRNCRAPDISFLSKQRLVRLGFKPSTRKFLPGAPDLAVEVLSPNNRRAEIAERLADRFTSGTQIAWIIAPDQQSAEVCHGLEQRRWIGPGGFLDGEHLLPGFRSPPRRAVRGLGLGLIRFPYPPTSVGADLGLAAKQGPDAKTPRRKHEARRW